MDQVITKGSGLGRKLKNGSIEVSVHHLGLQNILSGLTKDRGRWLKRGRSIYKCLQMLGFYLANLTSFCGEKSTSSVDEGKSVDVLCLDLSRVFHTNSFIAKWDWNQMDVCTRRWVGHWLDHQTQRAVVRSSEFRYWYQVTCGAHTELIEVLMLFNIFINNQNDYIESIVSKVWDNTRLGRADHTLDCSLLCRGISIRSRNGLRGASQSSMKTYRSSPWQNKTWSSLCQAQSGSAAASWRGEQVACLSAIAAVRGNGKLGCTTSLGSRVRDISSPVRLHQEYSVQSQVFTHLFLISWALLQENLIQIKGFVLQQVKEI